MSELGLFETIRTARALRRVYPDPIPPETINKVLEAATCAPSAGNLQNWYFVVITDAVQRKAVAELYSKASLMVLPFYANRPRPEHMTETEHRHFNTSGFYLYDHMAEAPALLLVCGRKHPSREIPSASPSALERNATCSRLASIYPAVQTIILACRALGLGTVLTTNHILCEAEIKTFLGIPDEIDTFALMPIGYPRDKFGPVKRKPLAEVAMLNRWGNAWKS
jgi:nitroreductase